MDALLPLLLDIDPGVVRLLPRLRGHLPPPSDHDEGGFEATQLRLFDGVVLLLRRLSADRPVLLVLDDLESADAQSLQLLRFLVRARSGGPLMVVGMYRSPLLPDAPAATALWSIAREPSIDVVTLAGLQQTDIGALMQAMIGGAASPALWPRRCTRAPAAIRCSRPSSSACWRARAMPGRCWTWRRCPPEYAGSSSSGWASCPTAAANCWPSPRWSGRSWTCPSWAAPQVLLPEALLDAMAPAMAGGVLVSDRPGQSLQVSFSHPLIRQSLYEDSVPDRAGRLAPSAGRPTSRSGRRRAGGAAGHHRQPLRGGGAGGGRSPGAGVLSSRCRARRRPGCPGRGGAHAGAGPAGGAGAARRSAGLRRAGRAGRRPGPGRAARRRSSQSAARGGAGRAAGLDRTPGPRGAGFRRTFRVGPGRPGIARGDADRGGAGGAAGR